MKILRVSKVFPHSNLRQLQTRQAEKTHCYSNTVRTKHTTEKKTDTFRGEGKFAAHRISENMQHAPNMQTKDTTTVTAQTQSKQYQPSLPLQVEKTRGEFRC